MKLSVSAYRAHSSAYKKILTNNYKSQLNYGSTAASISGGSHTAGLFDMESTNTFVPIEMLSSEGDDTTESKQGEAEANAPDSDQNTKKDEPEASNLEIRKPSQRERKYGSVRQHNKLSRPALLSSQSNVETRPILRQPVTRYTSEVRLNLDDGEREAFCQQQQQQDEEPKPSHTRTTPSWRRIQAVMAYYCSLRNIKRNGAI